MIRRGRAAMPAITPGALLELVRLCTATADFPSLMRAAASLPREWGIVYRPEWNGRMSVAFELVPPPDALFVAHVLEWNQPVGRAIGEPVTHWDVRLHYGNTPLGPVSKLPVWGHWPVYAVLERKPSGAPLVPEDPPQGHYALAPGDVVRTLRVGYG